VYIKCVSVFERVRVGPEAYMWSSWVGEWAWLVLGLSMVLLHHTRHNTARHTFCLTLPHPCVYLCACTAPLLHHLQLHLAPPDSIYNHKLR
jgi:hypothetical protein